MKAKSMGFIGGGRITRIILRGLERSGQLPSAIVVSDVNADNLNKLREEFPSIVIAPNDNRQPAACDIVFISLHPPVIVETLPDLRSALAPTAVLVSLAPKVTIARMQALGFDRVVRMIPNAPSVTNKGYNPMAFAPAIDAAERSALRELFQTLGECPEVPEEHLEAYAILTAMGPTYLWFQLFELQAIAQSFGLSPQAVAEGIARMVAGAVETMFAASLSPAEVMDLVPVKPLAEEEEKIREMYRTRLTALYAKLKG